MDKEDNYVKTILMASTVPFHSHNFMLYVYKFRRENLMSFLWPHQETDVPVEGLQVYDFHSIQILKLRTYGLEHNRVDKELSILEERENYTPFCKCYGAEMMK